MKQWIAHNWMIYAPVAAILVFISLLVFTLVVQSRYPEIKVADQSAADGSILVERAFLTSDGFVAIHRSDGKRALAPSPTIGYVPLEAGLNLNVRVRLSQMVRNGTKLYAVVHHDTGNIGRYEFREASPTHDPMATIDGRPAAASFVVR